MKRPAFLLAVTCAAALAAAPAPATATPHTAAVTAGTPCGLYCGGETRSPKEFISQYWQAMRPDGTVGSWARLILVWVPGTLLLAAILAAFLALIIYCLAVCVRSLPLSRHH